MAKAQTRNRRISKTQKENLGRTLKHRSIERASSRLFGYEKLEDRKLLASWTTLNNAPPESLGTMLLQTDGTVLAHGSSVSKTWYRLTPDANGSYVNGIWSSVASMTETRLYYGSNVLPDGRTLVLGGEYGSAGGWTNTGEIYNPQTNVWTAMASFPEAEFGDGQTILLPDGKIFAGDLASIKCYLYNPATNSWSAAGSKLHGDRNNEETWTLLPDGDVLSYDIFASVDTGIPQAQRYDFATGNWTDAGILPELLSSPSIGFEIGAALRLPNGRIFQIGGNSNTALYNPTTNTWEAGPDIPGGHGGDDTPAALMPNGHVVFTADIPLFNPPTRMFEFDSVANTISDITSSLPTALQNQMSSIPAYQGRMLMLPTGEMMFSPSGFSGNAAYVYKADGGPADAARPTISSITPITGNLYTITGTQLTGQSAGASYGEDAEMDTNYPIVQLTATDGSNKVYYARSYDWTPGVATGGAIVTSKFELPTSVPQGAYELRVIASGIASNPTNFSVGGQTLSNGEIGVLQVTSNWKTVNLAKSYVSPVVVAGPASLNGPDPVTVRVRNITKNSFDIVIDEWDYRDGIHGAETVSYIVMEAGHYDLGDGVSVEAGNVIAGHRWKDFEFSTPFDSTPVVISQIGTTREVSAAVTRMGNISETGFKLRVQEEQASDYVHANEKIGFIAFGKTTNSEFLGAHIEVGITPNAVTSVGYNIDYQSSFTQTPAFFAAMQSYNGGDPATVRVVKATRARARIFLEEERSYDAEVNHNPEVVGYVALQLGSVQPSIQGFATSSLKANQVPTIPTPSDFPMNISPNGVQVPLDFQLSKIDIIVDDLLVSKNCLTAATNLQLSGSAAMREVNRDNYFTKYIFSLDKAEDKIAILDNLTQLD